MGGSVIFEWLQENAIAIYGSVVGTVALFLNLGRFLFMYQKSVRKLKVESSIDSRAQETINDTINPKSIFNSEILRKRKQDPNLLIGPIYKVTVRNVSHITMHIQDVGLLIKEQGRKNKKPALIKKLEDSRGDDISAGAGKTYNIWLNSDVKIPNIIGCYAVDMLNKEHSGKHRTNGVVLDIPDKA